MTQIYNTLIQTPDNIDTQCYPKYLELYQKAVLNYEAANNNKIVLSGKRKDYKNYDYKIQNPVDFSKLFLSTSMAQYVGFDETCDSSALLTIIMCSDRSRLGGLADQVSSVFTRRTHKKNINLDLHSHYFFEINEYIQRIANRLN